MTFAEQLTAAFAAPRTTNMAMSFWDAAELLIKGGGEARRTSWEPTDRITLGKGGTIYGKVLWFGDIRADDWVVNQARG